MMYGKGLPSDITGTIKEPCVEPLCEYMKTMVTDYLKFIAKRLKKCCIAVGMDGLEDEREAGNCEGIETETNNENGEQGETSEAE